MKSEKSLNENVFEDMFNNFFEIIETNGKVEHVKNTKPDRKVRKNIEFKSDHLVNLIDFINEKYKNNKDFIQEAQCIYDKSSNPLLLIDLLQKNGCIVFTNITPEDFDEKTIFLNFPPEISKAQYMQMTKMKKELEKYEIGDIAISYYNDSQCKHDYIGRNELEQIVEDGNYYNIKIKNEEREDNDKNNSYHHENNIKYNEVNAFDR